MSEVNAAAQTSETTAQAQGSAPGNNDGKNTGSGQVETAPNQQGGAAPAIRREFFNLREKVRTEKETNDALRAELEALKAQVGSTGTRSQVEPDPLEDPKAYREAAAKQAREAARDEFNARLAEHNRQISALQANEMLRSRSHLQDDSRACDEVADILHSRFSHLRDVDPGAAAELSYLHWCKTKGVTPDLSNDQALNPPRQLKPSAAGSATSASDKTYTPDEVKRTLASLTDPKAINAYAAEVEKAAREGRYKGKFISR